MFGPLPAYGFYIRHASNVVLHGIEVKAQESDPRPILFLDDVKQSRFSHIQFTSYNPPQANIILKNSHNIMISGAAMSGSSPCLVKADGKNISGIVLYGNYLGKTENIYVTETSSNEITEVNNVKL